jgi:sulfatase-like protein
VMAGTPDDYRRSLGHLDRVVDRVVRTLKDAGWYDRALLVMTSDHAWRNDPNLINTIDHPGMRHVPLLIKVPGQRTPGTVESPVELNRLNPLFEAAVRGALDPEGAAHIVVQAQSAANRAD